MPRNEETYGLAAGDCVTGMQELDVHPDMIFADPPYNIGQEYDAGFNDKQKLSDYLEWSADWLRTAYETLAPHGTLWLVIGGNVESEVDVLAKQIGFHRRSHVIWYYTFGQNAKRNFTPSHTSLYYYVKSKTNYIFCEDDPGLRQPSARQLKYNDKRANPKGRLPDNTWILFPEQLPEGFDPQGDVWTFSRVCGTFKEKRDKSPNQLPLPLVTRCILATTNPGDLVLDPFTGTGTTGVACHRTDRRFRGFELSTDLVKEARQRIAAALDFESGSNDQRRRA